MKIIENYRKLKQIKKTLDIQWKAMRIEAGGGYLIEAGGGGKPKPGRGNRSPGKPGVAPWVGSCTVVLGSSMHPRLPWADAITAHVINWCIVYKHDNEPLPSRKRTCSAAATGSRIRTFP